MTVEELLRDVAARLARITEAIEDGDFDLAHQISVDLEVDVAGWFGANPGAYPWRRA